MDSSSISKSRLNSIIDTLVQRSFLLYLTLFVCVGLIAWLVLHYGTKWFKNPDRTVKIYQQAGVAAGIALVVCLIAFFGRLL